VRFFLVHGWGGNAKGPLNIFPYCLKVGVLLLLLLLCVCSIYIYQYI